MPVEARCGLLAWNAMAAAPVGPLAARRRHRRRGARMNVGGRHPFNYRADGVRPNASAGPSVPLPAVDPPCRVQVQNVHFCVVHGWTAVMSLHPVECFVPLDLESPLALVQAAVANTSSEEEPMEIEMEAPPPPPRALSFAGRRRCRTPTPTLLESESAGTIAAR
nr:uncharacterized protein LOC117841398 [Setaria viridis]